MSRLPVPPPVGRSGSLIPVSTEPLFSIITPVYNAGPFLLRTVQSVLRQTCADFEVILVDDGSTDDALDTVAALRDDRLRVLRQPHGGAPAASNAALERARGAYVALLDQDDLWAPQKLARHRDAFLANPDIDLTFTWTSFIGEADQDLHLPPRCWHGGVSFEQLLVDNVIGVTSSVAIRREVLQKTGLFDTSLPLVYDLDLYLRILQLRPANALSIPEVLTFYRRHSVQMSRDWRPLQRDWHALLQKLRKLAPEQTARLGSRADLNMTRYLAYLAYERRAFDDGCTLLAEAFRLDRLAFLGDLRNWKLTAACLSGRLLPGSLHRRLEALAGIRGFAAVPSEGDRN